MSKDLKVIVCQLAEICRNMIKPEQNILSHLCRPNRSSGNVSLQEGTMHVFHRMSLSGLPRVQATPRLAHSQPIIILQLLNPDGRVCHSGDNSVIIGRTDKATDRVWITMTAKFCPGEWCLTKNRKWSVRLLLVHEAIARDQVSQVRQHASCCLA